ncbi:MAG TPA: hypothetical protein VFX03_16885 [Thermomicrobiales bacterium]|nr:hypothetical protein [Thermomicrobiales bacterium]
MDEFAAVGGDNGMRPPDEWVELLARSLAHLAAQLTVAQIRLRALGSALAAHGEVDAEAVAARVRAVAAAEGAAILRENLGEPLTQVIDIDALERDLIAYLTETGAG